MDLFEKCVFKTTATAITPTPPTPTRLSLSSTLPTPPPEAEKKKISEPVREQPDKPTLYDPSTPTTLPKLASIPNNAAESELCEIEFDLEELPESETVQLKTRNDVYYEKYRDAKRKAKIARDLALSSYLEAKRIKNTYMLDDIEDSDEDFYKDDVDDDGDDDGDDVSNGDSEEEGNADDKTLNPPISYTLQEKPEKNTNV